MRWASWHQWQGAEELKWKREYKPPCLGRCAHTGEAISPSLKGSLQDWGLFLSCSRPKGGSEGWRQLPIPRKPSQLTWPGISTHVWAVRVGRGDVLSATWCDLLSSPAVSLWTSGMPGDQSWPGEATPVICCSDKGAGGCFLTLPSYFSSWHKPSLFVTAGGWLSHTKPNRKTMSFPAIFKDQKNAQLETQGFSQALSPTRLRGTKLKQL